MSEEKIIPSPPVEDVKTDLDINMDGFYIRQEQEVPDWYLKQLEDHKTESATRPEGDFMRIASIPVAIVEQWKRQGFDIYRESIPAIVKRLRQLGYDKLITTAKRIG